MLKKSQTYQKKQLKKNNPRIPKRIPFLLRAEKTQQKTEHTPQKKYFKKQKIETVCKKKWKNTKNKLKK
jgi:hypothetical protein